MLAEIYGWFSEGFDTADLQEARVLKVVIPPAVYRELTGMGAGQPGAMEVQTPGWTATHPTQLSGGGE